MDSYTGHFYPLTNELMDYFSVAWGHFVCVMSLGNI